MQSLTCHITGIIAGKINIGRGDFKGLPGPFHGSVDPEGLDCFRRLRTGGRLQRSPEWAGSNRIDPNALLRQIERQRTGKRHDRTLGGGIIDHIFRSAVSDDGSGIDNAVPLVQMREGEFRDIKEGKDIRGKSVVQLLGGNVFEALLYILNAAVIDHYLQAAKLPYRIFHHLAAGILIAKIRLQQQAKPSILLLDHPFCLLSIPALVQIGNGRIASFFGKSHRHRPADPAVAPGDDRSLSFELSRSLVFGIVKDRRRLHQIFHTGLHILLL